MISIDVDGASEHAFGSPWLQRQVAAVAMTKLVASSEQQCQVVATSRDRVTPVELSPAMSMTDMTTEIFKAPGAKVCA